MGRKLFSGRSRLFDGERFHETGTFKTKKTAKNRAESWRETGHKARIVKIKSSPYPYHLFTSREPLSLSLKLYPKGQKYRSIV